MAQNFFDTDEGKKQIEDMIGLQRQRNTEQRDYIINTFMDEWAMMIKNPEQAQFIREERNHRWDQETKILDNYVNTWEQYTRMLDEGKPIPPEFVEQMTKQGEMVGNIVDSGPFGGARDPNRKSVLKLPTEEPAAFEGKVSANEIPTIAGISYGGERAEAPTNPSISQREAGKDATPGVREF